MSTPLNNTLVKGFDVLGLFSPSQPEISVATVVDRLGMNQATAHRFLVTLEHIGALRATRRGHFSLGSTIEELGALTEATGSLRALIQPEIEALSRMLNESVMACRLTRDGVRCIAVANATRAISVNISVGTVLPLGSTAQGKLWLADMNAAARADALGHPLDPTFSAELDAIRRDGYARNTGDNEPDIAAVSVPVRGQGGEIAVTLSVFGMLSRFDDALVARARPALMAAAERVGQRL